ncbi:AAA family ATPase [Kurthia sibirica]|uniref:AAA+ ATPase domain-containing protein n=1 Tax=Kurthia sibirica TaxID=202750 RepID=A0A2U3AHY4_9BACL|nr:MoxR family ATPase [Kurthia sibirica]PWI24117.1 hypothetical protein DEX24_15090 [Kurthia sibirica]GEK35306.1 hypothetical protein KSI01_28390 [Kurthia sibirica]
MLAIIQQEIQKRQLITNELRYSNLIPQGGYKSPDEHLFEDVLVSLVLKKPVLLKGPSGSGKTKMAESIAALFNQPMHSINCSVDLDAESMLGFKTVVQKDNQTMIEFIEGPIVKAMKLGHLLYIDEINMAKPETLPILHSVLDYRRMLTNPFTGEVIHAHENFGVIAAINEGYIGTTPMNEALKNRFISYSVPYISGEQLAELLDETYDDLQMDLKQMMLNLSQDLRQQVITGLLSEEAASIRSLLDAIDLAQHIDISRAIQYAISEKLEDQSEKQLVMELANTWIG